MVSTETNVIADLAAKQHIIEQIYSYARGLDRMTRQLADQVWHSDGTADYGPGYRGSAAGFVDFVWTYHAGFEAHCHLRGNTIVKVDLASAAAASEAYVAVWLRTAPSDGAVTDILHRGRHVDRWSLRDGTWAIDHRTYVADIMHETTNQAGPETLGQAQHGRPVYTVL